MARRPRSDSAPDSASKPDLKPDELVEKLRPDPNKPSDAIEQCGFFGESDREDYFRLYWTRALTDYFEIANEDLVYRQKLPNGGSRIWIKPTAIVRFGPPREVQAADLPTQKANPKNAVWCPCPGGERSMMVAGINPMMLFFMGPYIWWAMAAQFCSTAAFTLGGGMVGAARIARGVVPPDRSLCYREGKTVLLGRTDYKDISC